jgi:hypothetical protein
MYKNVSNQCSTVMMRLNRPLNNGSMHYIASIKCSTQRASFPHSPIHQ